MFCVNLSKYIIEIRHAGVEIRVEGLRSTGVEYPGRVFVLLCSNLGKVEEIVAKLPNIVNTTSADMKPPLYFAVLAQSD